MMSLMPFSMRFAYFSAFRAKASRALEARATVVRRTIGQTYKETGKLAGDFDVDQCNRRIRGFG